MLCEELIELGVDVSNAGDAISLLTKGLLKVGYVHDTFCQAVLEREESFPTGLPTSLYGVAIPHTDPEHVLHTGMAVGILQNPVEFRVMGSSDQIVNVEVILLLAIQQPDQHIHILTKLMELFQTEETLQQLKNTSSKKDVLTILQQQLPASIFQS